MKRKRIQLISVTPVTSVHIPLGVVIPVIYRLPTVHGGIPHMPVGTLVVPKPHLIQQTQKGHIFAYQDCFIYFHTKGSLLDKINICNSINRNTRNIFD